MSDPARYGMPFQQKHAALTGFGKKPIVDTIYERPFSGNDMLSQLLQRDMPARDNAFADSHASRRTDWTVPIDPAPDAG